MSSRKCLEGLRCSGHKSLYGSRPRAECNGDSEQCRKDQTQLLTIFYLVNPLHDNIRRLAVSHFAMTSREGEYGVQSPGRGGLGLLGRIRRLKTHVLPFTDHTGKEALIVFEGREINPLPPLYGFAIYFTHPDVYPDTVDPMELLHAIMRDTPLENRCPIRLDLYFLPSSGSADNDDECIVHYRGEKAARGDYTRQIQAVENSATNQDEGQDESKASVDGSDRVRELPGLVPSYINDPISEFHHGLLYIYQSPDWRTDRRMARRVYFDPISQEEYAPLAEDVGEAEVLTPTCIGFDAIQQSDTTEQGAALVGMSMFEISHLKTENETNEPWHEAIERGWTSW